MANQEQLELLKQDVKVWNKWRDKNFEVNIDLSRSSLHRVNLDDASLRGADFFDANLSEASLCRAFLNAAEFVGANLKGTILSEADLSDSNLIEADLQGAKLKKTDLENADLTNAELSKADLRGAFLEGAKLIETDVSEADFSGAHLGRTVLAQIDLSKAYGLEKITHSYPSTIGTDTIKLSKGKIPEEFLRGCGLSDWEIESAKLYRPGLSNQEIDEILYKIHDLRAQQSIQISPLFISYSHADTSFVEKLETHLAEKGIRFWRDIHNATAGRLEKQIDRAMRQNPTVILILSENSTNSDWVEHEARLARGLEKEIGRDVLCPIALDESWKTSNWPKRLMEQIKEYNILDYSKWDDDTTFEQVFNKMISGLDMFYKK